jgi:hypothetical protein
MFHEEPPAISPGITQSRNRKMQPKQSGEKGDYRKRGPAAMNKAKNAPRTAFPSSQSHRGVAPEEAGAVTVVVPRSVIDVLALDLAEMALVEVVSSLLAVVSSLLGVVSLVGRGGAGGVGVGWSSSSLMVGDASNVVGSSSLVVAGMGSVVGGGAGGTEMVGAGFAVVGTPEPSHVCPSGQQPPNTSQYVPDLHHPPAPLLQQTPSVGMQKLTSHVLLLPAQVPGPEPLLHFPSAVQVSPASQ